MYDIVIVGAGSAGCSAAFTAAKRNFNVCLIDAKPRERVGDKICGNAIGHHHLERIGLEIPEDVKTNEIEGLFIYPPSLDCWEVPGGEYRGMMLDRLLFGQYLLNRAIDAGVELRDKTFAAGPIIDNGFVKGVEVRPNEKIYGNITIDCGGLRSFIREKLPKSFGIETKIEDKDVNIGYRERRKIKQKLESENFCRIYVNPHEFPGGYGWIFPESEYVVNVGLGVRKLPNHPNPRERLYETLLEMELFKDSEILETNGRKQAGGMDVSTRRSLASLVGNGILIAGEAGSIVDPVTGSGNGQAFVTGKFAAEIACDALEKSDVSRENLWTYNLQHYTEKNGYGQRYTPIDAFRDFLQSIKPEDLDYAREHGIIKEEDLITLTTKGELKLSLTDKAKRSFRGIGRLSLLRNLNYVKGVMEKIKNHCSAYPASPERFPEWKEKIDSIFFELEEKFKPYIGK